MHIKHAQTVHHGHLHLGGLIHVEVSFLGVLCIEGLLPLACRGARVGGGEWKDSLASEVVTQGLGFSCAQGATTSLPGYPGTLVRLTQG